MGTTDLPILKVKRAATEAKRRTLSRACSIEGNHRGLEADVSRDGCEKGSFFDSKARPFERAIIGLPRSKENEDWIIGK